MTGCTRGQPNESGRGDAATIDSLGQNGCLGILNADLPPRFNIGCRAMGHSEA
jgi:hypothetical protein